MSNVVLPDPESALCMFRSALQQMEFARNYTLELLQHVSHDRWFEIPAGLPTNIAWQVGHLAVSQYGLLQFRIRGRRTEDLELISGPFRKAYSRQTTPSSDADSQLSPEELLQRLQRVHETSLTEIADVTADILLEPVEMPYAAYPVKLGAVLFCPLHEMIHAGQIGLLRRALGIPSVR